MDDAIRNDTAMPPLADCARYWPVTLARAWASESTALLSLKLPQQAVDLFGGAAGLCALLSTTATATLNFGFQYISSKELLHMPRARAETRAH
jgi:hypothetical protein